MEEQNLNKLTYRTNSTEPNEISCFKTQTFGDISINEFSYSIPQRIHQMHVAEMDDLKLIDVRFIPKKPQFQINMDRTFYGTKAKKKSNKILPYLKLKNQTNQKIINQMRKRNREIQEQFKKLLPGHKNIRKSSIYKTPSCNNNKEETFITKIPYVEKIKKHKSVNNLKQYYTNKDKNLIQTPFKYSEKLNLNKLNVYKNEYDFMDKIIFNQSDNEKEEQYNEENIHKLIKKNKRLSRYLYEKKQELKQKKNKLRSQKTMHNKDFFRSYTVNNNKNLLNINKNINKLNDKLNKITETNSLNKTNDDNIKNLCQPNLNLNDIDNSHGISNKTITDNIHNILNSYKSSKNIKRLYLNKLMKDISSKNVYKINPIVKDNKLIDINNLLSELDIKMSPVYLKEIKNEAKLKQFLYLYKIMTTEQGINENYEDNNDKISERKNKVTKMKNKCKIILDELDKNNNFNLDQFVKEFKKSELAMTFKDFFYNYLLIILRNYDKKIVPNTFEIKTEPKEQPEDVKYCNFIKRHHYFKKLLNEQFNEGKQAKKLIESFIKKSKSKGKK